MGNKPWDREIINVRERPLSSDVNLIGSYGAQTLLDVVGNLMASRTSITSDAARPQPAVGGAAFMGAGFKPRQSIPAAAMSVTLDAGVGFYNDNTTTSNIGGAQGVNDQSAFKPLTLTQPETISVPAADPTNARIDIIEVKYDRRVADASSRDIFSPTAGGFIANAVSKTLSYNQEGRSTVNGGGGINYKTGTPAATPVAPLVDAGYVKIAEVDVAALATTVQTANIRDLRPVMYPGGYSHFSCRVIAPLFGGAPATIDDLVAPPGVVVAAVTQTNIIQGATGNALTLFGLFVMPGGGPGVNAAAAAAPVVWADMGENNLFENPISNNNTVFTPVVNFVTHQSRMVYVGATPFVFSGAGAVGGVSAGSFSVPTSASPQQVVGNGQPAWVASFGFLHSNGPTSPAAPQGLPAGGATAAWRISGLIPSQTV